MRHGMKDLVLRSIAIHFTPDNPPNERKRNRLLATATTRAFGWAPPVARWVSTRCPARGSYAHRRSPAPAARVSCSRRIPAQGFPIEQGSETVHGEGAEWESS